PQHRDACHRQFSLGSLKLFCLMKHISSLELRLPRFSLFPSPVQFCRRLTKSVSFSAVSVSPQTLFRPWHSMMRSPKDLDPSLGTFSGISYGSHALLVHCS